MNLRVPRVQHIAVDSDLGRFEMLQWCPVALARWVTQIWYFEGWTALARERKLPDGTVEIIVQLGERYRDVHGDDTAICPASCLSGLRTGPLVVEAPRGWNAVLGIKLRPEGAFALFGAVSAETRDLTADLRDVSGPLADELAESCDAPGSPRGRLGAAARWVEGRLALNRRVDPAIAWMAAEIEARRGAVSIAALREQVGMSKARLVETFRSQIGLLPKQFARIQRFRHLLGLLETAPASLAEAALEAGFYDQAHMSSEFRRLTGRTPTAFLGADRYPSSFSLAEEAPGPGTPRTPELSSKTRCDACPTLALA